jgi:hypothetical protein
VLVVQLDPEHGSRQRAGYCLGLSKALTRLFPIIGFQIITETSSPEDLPGIERDKQSIRPA